MEEQIVRRGGFRFPATVLASAAFVVLIVGITYFGILVYASHFAAGAERAAAYRELGMFLSGKLEWYRDARVYGAVSLLLALASVLCGVHPLARITLPVAGAAYVVLQFFGDPIRELLHRWATMG